MRISGITIKDDKHLEIALTGVYGVGRPLARKVLKELNIKPSELAKNLSTEQEVAIRSKIEALPIEGDLRREISQNIKRLKDIKAYRGSRHEKRLPVRGQRTKTNSRTLRGNARKTMGSGRRKLEKT